MLLFVVTIVTDMQRVLWKISMLYKRVTCIWIFSLHHDNSRPVYDYDNWPLNYALRPLKLFLWEEIVKL